MSQADSGAESLRRYKDLVHVGTVFLKDLNSVVHPVADVEQSVIGWNRAVDRVPELLCRFGIRIVRTQIRIVGFVAIGCPNSVSSHPCPRASTATRLLRYPSATKASLVSSSTMISATRPKFSLLRLPSLPPRFPSWNEEFAVARELQEVRVVAAVAADPDVVLEIDGDAVDWIPATRTRRWGRPNSRPDCLRSRIPGRAARHLQHMLVPLSNPSSFAARLSGRWITSTLSWESMDRPMVDPIRQLFGRGFGQNGSTSNIGTPSPSIVAAAGWAAGSSSIIAEAHPSTISTVRKLRPI